MSRSFALFPIWNSFGVSATTAFPFYAHSIEGLFYIAWLSIEPAAVVPDNEDTFVTAERSATENNFVIFADVLAWGV